MLHKIRRYEEYHGLSETADLSEYDYKTKTLVSGYGYPFVNLV
jgi:hypothetical protein